MLLYALSDFILTWVGARVTVSLDINNVGQCASVVSYVLNIHSASNVKTAIAYENADPKFFRL
jgi:hypothetical protein